MYLVVLGTLIVIANNDQLNMHIDLSGKNILVTGASRGIGKAIASLLDKSGARVIIHFNKNEAEARALAAQMENHPVCMQADLNDVDACIALFSDSISQLGSVDVVVNNAGVAVEAPIDAPVEAWLEAWTTTMQVNVRAVELLSRLAIQHFLTREGGRIINIASRAAFRGDTPGYMTYAASKAGMVALTKSIARAYGKNGITSFVVAPGFTRTDMAQDFIDRYGEAHAVSDIALSTLTQPEDIAPLVTFLASGLGDHATGTSIDVNAGSYVH